MNSTRKAATIVGALFLIAMVASLVGGLWLESLTGEPDYLTTLSANGAQVATGVLLELINGLCVVGIAVVVFPVIRKRQVLAIGYVAVRVLEAAFLFAAVIGPLALVTLSKELQSAGAPAAAAYQAAGTSLVAVRAHITGLLVPVTYGLSALLFYIVLYNTKLLPRFISIWGLIGVVLMLAWNLLELFGISVSFGLVLALPIMLNEVFLGIWLIAKGFEPVEL